MPAQKRIFSSSLDSIYLRLPHWLRRDCAADSLHTTGAALRNYIRNTKCKNEIQRCGLRKLRRNVVPVVLRRTTTPSRTMIPLLTTATSRLGALFSSAPFLPACVHWTSRTRAFRASLLASRASRPALSSAIFAIPSIAAHAAALRRFALLTEAFATLFATKPFPFGTRARGLLEPFAFVVETLATSAELVTVFMTLGAETSPLRSKAFTFFLKVSAARTKPFATRLRSRVTLFGVTRTLLVARLTTPSSETFALIARPIATPLPGAFALCAKTARAIFARSFTLGSKIFMRFVGRVAPTPPCTKPFAAFSVKTFPAQLGGSFTLLR